MADLNIDTTSAAYQQALTVALPWIKQQMILRRPLLLKLAAAGEKDKLVAWRNRDPLLSDVIDFVDGAGDLFDAVRNEIG